MDITFWLPIVKVIHLGGLILWLGPSGGAWLLVQLSKRRLDQQSDEYHELYRDFLKFFWVEHLGLFLLMGSGLLLLTMYGSSALEWTWLQVKIALVLCVIIPVEALDIWFGHVRLPRQFSTKKHNTHSGKKMNSYELYEHRFAPLSLPLLLATIIVIMWLAMAKPT